MFNHELTESVSPHSTVKQTRATRRVFRRLQATIERSGGWGIDLNLVFLLLICLLAHMTVEKVLEHCPIGFMYDIYLPMNLPFETWLLIDKCKGQYINIPSRHFIKARRIYDKLPRDHWCYVCLMRKTFSQSFRRRLNKFWFDTDDTDQHFQRFFTISTSSFALLLENDENGHTSGHFGVWGLESLAFLTAQLAVGLARSEMLVCWRLVLRSRIHGIPIIHSHFTQMLVKGQCGLESFCLAVTSYCEFIVHASQPRWEIPCEHF